MVAVSHIHQFTLRERSRPQLSHRFATAIVVAILGAALTFFFSLFCAIVVMLVSGLARNVRPDMTVAYRLVAIPAAIIALPTLFAVSLLRQVRARRQRTPLI